MVLDALLAEREELLFELVAAYKYCPHEYSEAIVRQTRFKLHNYSLNFLSDQHA